VDGLWLLPVAEKSGPRHLLPGEVDGIGAELDREPKGFQRVLGHLEARATVCIQDRACREGHGSTLATTLPACFAAGWAVRETTRHHLHSLLSASQKEQQHSAAAPRASMQKFTSLVNHDGSVDRSF